MNAARLFSLSLFDLKNIFRDKTLTAMFIVPLLMIALLRFGIPPLTEAFPEVQPYYPIILGYFCVLVAFFPGFIISFIMLDEKDEQLIPVLRVMPVSPASFIIYRLAFLVLLGFLFSFATIWLTPLLQPPFTVSLILSILCALVTPITTLLVVTFARNKIEGITMLKGLNMALLLPVLAFVVDSAWADLLGILPVYWTYCAFHVVDQPFKFATIGLVGVAVHTLYFWVTYRQFRNRVFP